jgi:hypothetical protein
VRRELIAQPNPLLFDGLPILQHALLNKTPESIEIVSHDLLGYYWLLSKQKVKISLFQAVGAPRVARG